MRQIPSILFLFFLFTNLCFAQESILDRLGEKKVLKVGTTADYRPFTYLEAENYAGYDVDVARLIADELAVRVQFVPTTWAGLTDDLIQHRFDLAVGGITRTLKRQQFVGFTTPVFHIGKCPLVRKADATRLASIEAINRSGVRIGVNPGGTNERYVRENFPKASLLVVEDNLAIPGLVASGDVDVMITDNLEAIKAAQVDSSLTAVSAHKPWTKETLAFMAPRDDQAFINWLNLFLYQAEADGRLGELRLKYGL